MKEQVPWYEDDDLWRDMQPFVFNKTIMENAGTDVENLLELLEIAPTSRILDLCCGLGRHSLELAGRGFRVTGVDRTRLYIDQARQRAEAEEREVEFIVDDMRSFRRDGAFDVVINMFTAFGYFDDEAEDRRVLENIYASLRPGGKVVIDVIGKEIVARIFQSRDWRRGEDGCYLLEERVLLEDLSRIQNTWVLLKDGDVRTFAFSLRLFSATELRRMLREVGFATITCFGSLQGAAYDNKAGRLIVLAEK